MSLFKKAVAVHFPIKFMSYRFAFLSLLLDERVR